MDGRDSVLNLNLMPVSAYQDAVQRYVQTEGLSGRGRQRSGDGLARPGVDDLQDVADRPAAMRFAVAPPGPDLTRTLAEVERDHIARVVASVGGNKTRAAKLLGFNSYQTLGNWRKRHSNG